MHRMRRGRVSLPALALIGLLVLLGHDSLMAANPHAQAAPHAEHAAGHQPVQAECGVQGGTRPSSLEMPGLDGPIGAPPVPSRHTAASLVGPAAWSIAPTYPPDVRRALLQVFLN